jgi:phospholipid/cholesterol/gamma-HCH transport system permease protein
MTALFYHIGRYTLLMSRVFSKPEKWQLYRRQFAREVMSIGLGSLGLVALISFFMGAVITLQTASNIDSPLIPLYTIGFTARQSTILEFSPTIIALILAGKVGSNISSEIGSMRISEQIDALEIMGVNSAAYLVLPKIVAAIFINPVLIIYSMFLSLLGGWFVGVATGIVSSNQYIYGIQYDFDSFSVTYALIKTVFFW